MNKHTVLESNGMNVMEFLEVMLENRVEKGVILNSLSFHYSGSKEYIHDWRTRARNKRIKELYHEYKLLDIPMASVYRKIADKVEREFVIRDITVKISARVARHVIECRQ